MQLRDCKPGMRLRLINKAGGAADVGAIAVVAETSSYDDKYVNVNWDRTNGLDHGQMNGQYRPESFEEIKMRFKKGDKIAMTMVVVKDFDTALREEGQVVVDNNPSATNLGCMYLAPARFDDVKESDIVRAPVPLAVGQVWQAKGGSKRLVLFVDSKSVYYESVRFKERVSASVAEFVSHYADILVG